VISCELDFSEHTRQLYATDASLYQIAPVGVAFPKTAREAAEAIQGASAQGWAVIPRGAGSGLTGGALGDGLVVDFARHNRQISELNLERRSVRVGAGVVLDQLNDFLRPHGWRFGPDVATSSRATLGGMIANNSSGTHAPFYGCTGDHVLSLEMVMADGSITDSNGLDRLKPLRHQLEKLLAENQEEIRRRMPPGLTKRWPGYGLDRCLREPDRTLPHLLAGSEGTLAGIWSAELRIVPLPRARGLGLLFFASVAEAMQATVDLLDLQPAAIEHIDRILFDQTRGQLAFQAARDLLELETAPCEAILIVEFFDEVGDKLAALSARRLGLRSKVVTAAAEMNLVWNLRKAGLSLLTGCPGPAKPVTCIEDAAVRPADLPAYVAGLQAILKPLGVAACYYGHAASGLLHVRPVLDLHTAEGVRHLRLIATEVAGLVRQFNGSLAAEHGVGIARAEFMPGQLGEPLLGAMREIKRLFDPQGLLNPGKITPDGRYRIDTHLRQGAGKEMVLPFAPVLAFAARDHSFIGNLEQCNGCGGCLKSAPVMCPTYIATGREIMSTRGRANTIRAVLEGRLADSEAPLDSPALAAALENCLSCKACAAECPSNVNLPLLKADLLHARQQRSGLPLRAWLISRVDLLGKLGCLAPAFANALLSAAPVRRLLEKTLGLASPRPLPAYAAKRFDHWFHRRARAVRRPAPRGKVILWDDTFTRYHEPHIGRAAVKVLEAAGYEVALLTERVCCGRPAFSQGDLGQAARLGRHNLALLAGQDPSWPVIFLEPSCWAMFAEDYRELGLPHADQISGRCLLFEHFVDRLLQADPAALPWCPARPVKAVIHAHCQAKALLPVGFMPALAGRAPGSSVTLLDTGCCGMAGAFGSLAEKYELSRAVAEPLIQKIDQQTPETAIIASGASCRHQIEHLARRRPIHMAEWLAEALEAPETRLPNPVRSF